MVFCNEIVKVCCKTLQGYIGINTPIPGQKMVVKNIDDHAAVVAVIRMETLAALTCNGMTIRKGVYGPMEENAVFDLFREVFIPLTANTIGDKIPNGELLIFKGKINMSQKIHALRR